MAEKSGLYILFCYTRETLTWLIEFELQLSSPVVTFLSSGRQCYHPVGVYRVTRRRLPDQILQ